MHTSGDNPEGCNGCTRLRSGLALVVEEGQGGAPRIDGVKMGVNYGGNKTRFIAPVRAGKRIRGHWKLTEMVEKRPGQWQQTCEITIEIEGEDKPALMAEWITQYFV